MKKNQKLEKLSDSLFQNQLKGDALKLIMGGTCTSCTYTTTTSCGCTKTDTDTCCDIEA